MNKLWSNWMLQSFRFRRHEWCQCPAQTLLSAAVNDKVSKPRWKVCLRGQAAEWSSRGHSRKQTKIETIKTIKYVVDFKSLKSHADQHDWSMWTNSLMWWYNAKCWVIGVWSFEVGLRGLRSISLFALSVWCSTSHIQTERGSAKCLRRNLDSGSRYTWCLKNFNADPPVTLKCKSLYTRCASCITTRTSYTDV